MSIKDRKKDHVDLTAAGDMSYQVPTGFEQYYFAHNALPEINIDDVSTQTTLLGRSFSFPLFISSMTGGYTDAGAVNAIIAEFCADYNLPFGVGSQRIMLEDNDAEASFSVVREKAPDAFIAANIGGAQLVGGLSPDGLQLLIESIEADAVIVHLNPLQELMQPEGDRNFKGIEEGIQQLCSDTNLPVIVKETGAGISGSVGQRLLEAGVNIIDVAGAGGTSWAKVENERASNKNPDTDFNNWGIPTLECVTQLTKLKSTHNFELIASGGIRSSHDIAKSLCLGADFAASAQPIIKAIVDNGYEGLEGLFLKWKKQLITILTLLGCESPSELNPNHLKLKQ
ncbi:type 2 isopentenyl-diphosphate Delta-isomerase [Fodinibius sp. Rm-B-1B1-1]|uniref:type 2 isopentenyl-diphosphate Delta-isomerase n=1 Tax=Fodinibius alkaliphilus TaxID=3140241 RepID=UPI00315AA93F